MNKAAIVADIIAQLDAELERYARAARDAQTGATDEQSKPENKYDTRGLEASYLAHGQSRQALETVQARQQLAAMAIRDLDDDGERMWYLVAPAAGGREVFCEVEITVVTPVSPLGGQLMGKRAGESARGLRVLAVM